MRKDIREALRHIKKRKRRIAGDDGGYYTVEAAIFLPIFILAIVTIGYLIKVTAAEEEMMHVATEESGYLAMKAYTAKRDITFPYVVQSGVVEENEDLSAFAVRNFRYLYEEDGLDSLISFDMDGYVDVNLPMKMFDGFDIRASVKFRGFTGTDGSGEPFSFEDMGREDDSTEVWVFPQSGVRYHREGCTFIASSPVQTLMGGHIRDRYSPCELCNPGEAGDGSLIYYFPGYGTAYHRGGCKTIDKYVVSMSRTDAESRGYTPCLKCKGVKQK